VEMWPVVRGPDLREHPDDDSEEARNLGHPTTLPSSACLVGLTIAAHPRPLTRILPRRPSGAAASWAAP
jgi:hypothetical protein